MKRGEVWTIAGGADYTGKPRPAVVVQDESFDMGNSVTICGLTSVLTETTVVADTVLRPEVEPSETNGLKVRSQVMTDKVTTIPRSKLGAHIGELAEQDILNLDQALLVFLGLARRTG